MNLLSGLQYYAPGGCYNQSMPLAIIDVREPSEYTASHVAGALNIPLGDLPESGVLKVLPKNAQIIVYCHSGGRSNMAIQILHGLEFTNVTNGISKEQVSAHYNLT